MSLGLAACAGDTGPKSRAAFCAADKAQSARFGPRSGAAPLTVSGLLTSAHSVADGQAILSRLDRTAPPEISADVSTVLTAWSTLGDEAGGGLAGAGGALSSGLASAPDATAALGRVDLYVATHC